MVTVTVDYEHVDDGWADGRTFYRTALVDASAEICYNKPNDIQFQLDCTLLKPTDCETASSIIPLVAILVQNM
jgi:hypothetical protein